MPGVRTSLWICAVCLGLTGAMTASPAAAQDVDFIVGAKHRNGLFFEMKIGTMDSPDLKFGAGYTFR